MKEGIIKNRSCRLDPSTKGREKGQKLLKIQLWIQRYARRE